MASPASFRPEGLQAMTRNHFKHLPPSSDLNKVSDAVRKCIEILKKNKISTKELADMITEASEGEVEPNENTLKAFISRSETGRTNKSATLEILFNFFLDNWRSFENPMRAEMAGVWENFVPDLETNGESRRIFGATMEHVFGGLLNPFLLTIRAKNCQNTMGFSRQEMKKKRKKKRSKNTNNSC